MSYIATFLSLLGNVFIVRKSKWGFVIWTAGNAVWIWVDIHIGLHSQIIMMAVYSALNIWGLVEWGRGKCMQRLYPRLKFADINNESEQFAYIQGEVKEAQEAKTQLDRDFEIADVEQAIQTYWDIRAKQGLSVDVVRAGTMDKNRKRGYEA
jgi:hypothetical protein